ncbi:hypothetical protein [Streptomyces sp. RKAG337]|uniref:hypothetical protein n=1 Tax=Streptomyces sp. RKAG337 TaxID=2893404 RepID=UPI002033F704|nr:hypothetical protein [Streptomyces sp. RKAG337]MCM2424866.1 hypothetical protein [Streptomyces sp. RKAG337]
MALHVHLPIRVRLTGRITPRELALLERAVGDATETALLTARREVLDARGTGRRLVLDRPAADFVGPPLDLGLRERVRETVERGLTAGIAAAGLSRPAAPARARTGSGATEPFDAARARTAHPVAEPDGETLGPGTDGEAQAGTYLLPFYDKGGAPVPVPLAAPRPAPARSVRRPATGGAVTLAGALHIAWDAHLDRAGPVWPPGAHGYPGYAGPVVIDGVERRVLVWINEVDRLQPDGTVLPKDYGFRWRDFRLLQLGGADQRRPTFRLGTPAFGLAAGELIRTDRTPTIAVIEQTIAELLDLERAPSNHPLRDGANRRRYAEQLATGLPSSYVICSVVGVRRQFALMPGDIDSPIRFVTAQAGQSGGPQPAGAGAGRPGAGSKPRPKPKSKPKPKVRAKAQGKPKAGAKPGGPPGDPAHHGVKGAATEPGKGDDQPPGGPLGRPLEADSSGVWPVITLADEPLRCGSHNGEPALLSLRQGGEALAADMLRIARLLDVPQCAHAGMFALNCARVISSSARDVGLASVHSTVTTQVTVRADRGGNNGLLDVRPGPAPELDYLHQLAQLVSLIDDLAHSVVAAYLHHDNAALIAPDAGQAGRQAASWALRFLEEMSEALSTACMHLYAETCRVLLLQQLRSSRAAITQYAGPRAKETQEHFEQVLNVLGGSAVQLIVLRRAVRHAEKLGVTGTLREVLSRQVTVHGAGYAEYDHQEPAPIDSVSARTLAELDDARIERIGTEYWAFHAGRHWTVRQIETGIDARRAVLNQIDPLFLQVGDLERLFRESTTDPGRAGAYLIGLLAEMAKANEEMLTRASEPKDGAFFALEVSQWVERKGGRDERGLWFELHGIHALADDQLREYAGHLAVYSDGVNRAILRKAGVDQLEHLFATAGVVVLGLLCAPLGAAVAGLVTGVVGASFAVEELISAQDQKRTYRSVLDPEALVHWQDVEMAELMAWIGIAFSVFDIGHAAGGAKAIAGGALKELRQAGQQGVRVAAQSALRSTRKSILENLSEELLRHAVQQAVTQAAVVLVMETLVPLLIRPVAESLMRESARLHGTGAQLEAALAALEAP